MRSLFDHSDLGQHPDSANSHLNNDPTIAFKLGFSWFLMISSLGQSTTVPNYLPKAHDYRHTVKHLWLVILYCSLIVNVRSLSLRTFPFMGMFEWEEGLIPQSPGSNAPTQATNFEFYGIGANSYNWLHDSSIKSFKLQSLYTRVSSYYHSMTIKLLVCLRKHLFLTSSSQMLVALLPATPGLDARWMVHPEYPGYSHLSYTSTLRQAWRDTKFQSMVSIFYYQSTKGSNGK